MLAARLLSRPWTVSRGLQSAYRCYLALVKAELEPLSEEVAEARRWLDLFKHHQIPRQEFEITFSRSLGPGGQKVNKTSSKATVALAPHKWLNPYYTLWIPKAVAAQLQTAKVRYETKMGGITIQSDVTRNRETNTDECFRKLLEEIHDKVEFAGETLEETKERWQEIKTDRKEKRLFNKKKLSDKKKLRGKLSL